MEKFLPGRHLIDSFGNGGFRLGGISHVGSVLIVPSGVRALPVTQLSDLSALHIDLLLSEKANIDMLLIGTGREMLPLPRLLANLLQNGGMGFDFMSTNAAVRTYNVVLEEQRRIAAILLAVDKAYG